MGQSGGRGLIPDKTCGREREQAVVAEHEDGVLPALEDHAVGLVGDVEPAGQCAEGGQHQPAAVGHETGPADGSAETADAGSWMQMAADLARRSPAPIFSTGSWRKVSGPMQNSSTVSPHRRTGATGSWLPVTQIHSRFELQGGQHCPVGRGQAVGAVGVVKTVAEANDAAGSKASMTAASFPAWRRVIGRQHDAAAGETGAFFQVKIGNHSVASSGHHRTPLS
jgi:hypothetical protein